MKSKNVTWFRRILPQFLAGFAQSLLVLDLGAALGYQIIIIGNLLHVAGQPSFTDNESSWFASFLFTGQSIGCFTAAIFLEPIGHKKSMIAINIPFLAGWIMTATAQSILPLYAASFSLGLGAGCMASPTIKYIVENTEPEIRSIMTSITCVAMGFGSLVVYILGVWYDWRTIAYICALLPIVSAVAIALIPESPIWLLAHKRIEEAEKALCWLRGWVQPEMVQEEFSELLSYISDKISKNDVLSRTELNIQLETASNTFENNHVVKTLTNENRIHGKVVEADKKENLQNINSHKTLSAKVEINSKIKNFISDLLEPDMLHALLFMNGFFFFQVAAGANVVSAYTISVFEDLRLTLDPFKANVVSSGVGILGTVTLMIVVHHLGKRRIALFSILGSAVFCIAIGVCALYPNTTSEEGYWSLPFIIYTINNYTYGFGLGPLAWMYMSEVIPFRGRGAATGICAAMNNIFNCCATKTFFTIKNAISLPGVFFLYGVISVLGFVFLYFLLPETEGRTLQDIEKNQRKI